MLCLFLPILDGHLQMGGQCTVGGSPYCCYLLLGLAAQYDIILMHLDESIMGDIPQARTRARMQPQPRTDVAESQIMPGDWSGQNSGER